MSGLRAVAIGGQQRGLYEPEVLKMACDTKKNISDANFGRKNSSGSRRNKEKKISRACF
jgi:hypothetical protein